MGAFRKTALKRIRGDGKRSRRAKEEPSEREAASHG